MKIDMSRWLHASRSAPRRRLGWLSGCGRRWVWWARSKTSSSSSNPRRCAAAHRAASVCSATAASAKPSAVSSTAPHHAGGEPVLRGGRWVHTTRRMQNRKKNFAQKFAQKLNCDKKNAKKENKKSGKEKRKMHKSQSVARVTHRISPSPKHEFSQSITLRGGGATKQYGMLCNESK